MDNLNVKTWNIESMTGYKPITTFYEDFSIADKFGLDAIKDTYGNAFKSWKNDYKYITELVMVLNWKIWEHYENGDKEIAKLYDQLWRWLDNWCFDNLKNEELDYYIRTID